MMQYEQLDARFLLGENPTVAALTEEVGELAQAMLHIREGKGTDWTRVYREAVQVAVMAMRAATEGDHTLGVKPTWPE